MNRSFRNAINLVRNMGWRYMAFRTKHELLQRTGLLKRRFPVNPEAVELPSLDEWKKSKASFFFESKEEIGLERNPTQKLQNFFEDFQKGELTFFGSTVFHLGKNYNWTTQPETGFRFDNRMHWSAINDFSRENGDIKYVWEKSRFGFIYNLIRYDYHFNKDCSTIVFSEILSWIDHNPINCGPNYKCSQEISLRVLNWLFALYYYKNSSTISEQVFRKIMHHIYWQIKHVYSNIDFSRIAVRNNHAITETMTVYLAGILLPFFPESETWKKRGKAWFEKEIAYQVYPDGTYLQFSMNYHRVVVQLLTWGIRLSEINKEELDPVVKSRATASLNFMVNCMNEKDGRMPAYGANDGALFFPLNNNDSLDYRPQLHALSAVLGSGTIQDKNEDQFWYGIKKSQEKKLTQGTGMQSYPIGGFYLLREPNSFSFIRCGNHKDRPSQADNLHLDIWANGINIFRDGGTYKYNTDEESQHYFFGTSSHNTVMLADYDQMQKGGRFIWYYWTNAVDAAWSEHTNYYEFKGSIKAFQHVKAGLIHTRTIRKYKSTMKWEITDEFEHPESMEIHQLWHKAPADSLEVLMSSVDENGEVLKLKKKKGWHSARYGLKEESETYVFSTLTNRIHTIIEVRNGR